MVAVFGIDKLRATEGWIFLNIVEGINLQFFISTFSSMVIT
jgi:hypothetical protein